MHISVDQRNTRSVFIKWYLIRSNCYFRDQAIELGYSNSGLFVSTFKYPLPTYIHLQKLLAPLLRPEKMLCSPPKKNKNYKYIIMKNIAIKNDCSVIFWVVNTPPLSLFFKYAIFCPSTIFWWWIRPSLWSSLLHLHLWQPKNRIQNETSVLEKYLFNTGSREMVLTIVFGLSRSM